MFFKFKAFKFKAFKFKAAWIAAIALFFLTASLVVLPAIARDRPTSAPAIPPTPLAQSSPQSFFEQGTRFYQDSQFAAAATAFQQAAQTYQIQGGRLKQAAALSNLSLAEQQLGQWPEAQQALDQSLRLLGFDGTLPQGEPGPVLAQALEIQGGLYLATGQPDRALEAWQLVETLYTQSQDPAGLLRTQLNRAKALQVKGFYRRALTILEGLAETLTGQPDSVAKAVALRSLGDTLQLTGDLDQSRRVLQASLDIAQRLQSPEHISAAQFSLGNTARAQQDPVGAIAFYQQAATMAPTRLAQVQAQINHLSLLEASPLKEALLKKVSPTESSSNAIAIALFNQIQTQLPQLPPSRASAYAHIHLAQTAITHMHDDQISHSEPSLAASFQKSITMLLRTAMEYSQQLQDESTRAYALGTLGHFQEQQEQWQAAQRATEAALLIAQSLQAPESAYRWQWQLGRIFTAQGDLPAAKASYESAIATLRSLRRNLVAINRTAQFDFRDSVEPVYREAVALLLTMQKTTPSETNLEQARTLMDQLQLAELDNFFREACLDGQQVVLDQLVDRDNPSTAIIYPIILEHQLQVIVKIPNQPLRNYAIDQSQATTVAILNQLRSRIVQSSGEKVTQRLAQQVYGWLIEPIAANLAQSGVNTLVFVLDREFRNLPMAALYDGQHYLIEKYAVALSVGLQLLPPRALAQNNTLTAIAAGLTEPSPEFQAQGYASLPEIKTEFTLMQQAGVKTTILLDQAFDRKALAQTIQSLPFKIVHLATHGKFSSQADDTYILAADGAIYVNEFDTLLRDRGQAQTEPIELLVLSACQTAAGDNRAALGLAGVAIRAGARSTLASLWQVDDRATALLMGKFYQELATAKVSKAEALRRAQLALLKQEFDSENPSYPRPRYWAAFVMVGNWL
jgi:CHAT domain-containing protein/tetratricopeptide (TPR) repeat protein